MKIKIGLKNQLPSLPTSLEILNRPYILNKNENGKLVLYDAVCPHFNGVVSEIGKNLWRCPSHDWKFDPLSGNCINSPSKHLHPYPVTFEENKIYVDLPIKNNTKDKEIKKIKDFPKITLVSNACLLLEWKNFRLLTDPWMVGPIFSGSCTSYPPTQIKILDLPKINAIWISHEHSDHLNKYTLSFFDKDIQIFVPNYDENRLKKQLEKLNFKNITSLSNGETKQISSEIKITSFFSGSVWNDSIQLIQLGDFKILNLNDAGFNWKVKENIDKVDLVCTQFTGPGSSYPLSWNHLNDAQKQVIIKKSNKGFFEWLKQIAKITKADYLLPFANFLEIYHPLQFHYIHQKPQNTINDVVELFKNSPLKVLDLIPGESWDGKILRIVDREKYFDKKFKINFLKEIFKKDNKIGFAPIKFDISDNEIISYFNEFSNSFLAIQVGDYSVHLIISGNNSKKDFLILFKDGKISMKRISSEPNNPNLIWECPGAILQEIISNDLSWDESHLGYSCTFSRNPDVYNIAFWKILHAPWRARKSISLDLLNPVSKVSIADLIEKHGNISKIFEKYGLFCIGCGGSIGENVDDACKIHGFSDHKKNHLVNELELFLKAIVKN